MIESFDEAQGDLGKCLYFILPHAVQYTKFTIVVVVEYEVDLGKGAVHCLPIWNAM